MSQSPANPGRDLLRPLTNKPLRKPRRSQATVHVGGETPQPAIQPTTHGRTVLELAKSIAESRGGHGPLLSVKEASERLGVGIYRLYERIHLGDLPVVRMGRRIRIDQCALDAWIRVGGSDVSA